MKWRRVCRAVHRDLGYITVALVLAYGVSGVAVNHMDDWNPNYAFENTAVEVGPLPADDFAAMERHVIDALGIDPRTVRGHFMENQVEFRVFLDNEQEVSVDVRNGRGTLKTIATRAVLFEVNALHLNNLKGVWTWIADLFALALIMLAGTGLFMNKGRRGLSGRGKWFVGAGLLVPIAFVIHLYG